MKSEHVHKYMKVIMGGRRVVKGPDGKRRIETTGGYPIMKCMHPGCTHYVAEELAVGRQSICWKCGSELILNKENMTLKKPTHRECRKTRALTA